MKSSPFIPLVDLKAQYRMIENDIDKAIKAVFDRADFILGKDVEEFETAFAAYCGTNYAIGCGSGTEALHLAMWALDIGAGDEVIIPAMTFIATALAVTMCGAKPVLVDVESNTSLIDPAELKNAITSKTRAIIPVHLFGQCANMDAISSIAEEHNVYVIEDAAQAHGALYGEVRAGNLGDIGCFSFYPGKNLGAYGDGGLVTTNKLHIAERIKLLRNWGTKHKYRHEVLAVNSRLDTIQAAVLKTKLPYLDRWNEKRRYYAKAYDNALNDLPGVRLTHHSSTSVYHLYVIKVSNRNAVIKALNNSGIGAGIHYPFAVHEQQAYKELNYPTGQFPISEDWARRCVSLPMYAELPEGVVDRVATILKDQSV